VLPVEEKSLRTACLSLLLISKLWEKHFISI
jgi:hypothetical protein